MNEYLQRFEYIMVYLIGLAIAVTLMTMPKAARSDDLGYDDAPAIDRQMRDQVKQQHPRQRPPRWSNQHHYEAARAARTRDCAFSPDYVPGVDAWGDPVIPADLPRRYKEGVPAGVDVDINLGHKWIGGHHAYLSAGDIYYDLANRELSVNGVPMVKDCIPATK